MIIFSIACTYLLIGLLYGLRHADVIQVRLNEVGTKEEQLRNLVKTYELTPQGAEYFMKLQDLHLMNGELLEEYKKYKSGETKYVLKTIALAMVCWPYYFVASK